MRFVYTCRCGKAMTVNAESLALADLGAKEAGWSIEFAIVTQCKECANDEPGRIREESDQQAPR